MALFNKSQSDSPSYSAPVHHASREEMGDTVIAQGVRVEGQFSSSGNVVIEGEVHGSLTSGQDLTVGPHARIVADIKAGNASIAGEVEGNVRVSGRLELKATAKVLGDVFAEEIAIEIGAVLNGKVTMKQQAAEAPRRKKVTEDEMTQEEVSQG